MDTSASCVKTNPIVVPMPVWRQLFAASGEFYCRLFHRAISRPVDGKYRCWECLREYELDW